MLHLRMFLMAVLVLALPSVALAQTWTSPDGFLSVTPPDAQEFHAQEPPPPPFLVFWVSSDEATRFGIIKVPIQLRLKLDQSGVEQGLAEEIGGEVTRLPTKEVSGHEVWMMTGRGETVEVTQSLIRQGESLYKLMALSVGENPGADPVAVNRFFDSLAIADPSPAAEQTAQPSVAPPDQDPGGGIDTHQLSKTIGGAAALLGIGLVVYFLTRGKKADK